MCSSGWKNPRTCADVCSDHREERATAVSRTWSGVATRVLSGAPQPLHQDTATISSGVSDTATFEHNEDSASRPGAKSDQFTPLRLLSSRSLDPDAQKGVRRQSENQGGQYGYNESENPSGRHSASMTDFPTG